MASKIKVDQLETADGTGTIALQNQLSGMTTASLPTVTTDKLGTGAILRQFFVRITTDLNTTSTSYIDLGGASEKITLTPLSASSKFYITASVHSYLNLHTTDGWHAINYQLLRDTTAVTGSDSSSYNYGFAKYTADDNDRNMSYVHRQWQDEPATTSEITYKLQVQSRFGYNAIFNDFGESSMCILEVQG